jgi:nitrate reductase molybdenum cofactor assembly chaperone NarJ/NarW
MSLYSILSALLDYPEPVLLDALPDIETALRDWPQAEQRLAPLVASLKRPLIESQLTYVSTFDRNPSHSLHLFEHIHGESRDRGQAMVDLLDEYRGLGFEIEVNELPDYVPLFLEVLGAVDAERAQALLNDAIHVLDTIGERLARDQSPYAGVFAVLRELATVEPRPLGEPPVRDMDEMLETFGPGPDGVEPLLAPHMRQDTQTIRFHPRAASNGAGAPIAKDAR